MIHKSPFLSDALSAILPTLDQTMLLRACLWTGEASREAWMNWQNDVFDAKQVFKENKKIKELLPLLYHALEQNKADVSESLRPYLRTAYVHEELRSRTYRHILKETISTLINSGIPFLLLEGASLAESIYGNWALRHCNDINLLLRKADLLQAMNVLSTQRNFHVSGARRNSEANHFILKHTSGLPVHLSHLLFEDSYHYLSDEIWKHAEQITMDGIAISILCTSDCLINILGRAFFSASNSWQWICDAYYLFLKRGAQLNWDFLFQRIIENHLVLPFWVMFNYLATELKGEIPSFFLQRLANVKTTKEDCKEALLKASASSRGFKKLFKHTKNLRERIFLSRMLIQKIMN